MGAGHHTGFVSGFFRTNGLQSTVGDLGVMFFRELGKLLGAWPHGPKNKTIRMNICSIWSADLLVCCCDLLVFALFELKICKMLIFAVFTAAKINYVNIVADSQFLSKTFMVGAAGGGECIDIFRDFDVTPS